MQLNPKSPANRSSAVHNSVKGIFARALRMPKTLQLTDLRKRAASHHHKAGAWRREYVGSIIAGLSSCGSVHNSTQEPCRHSFGPPESLPLLIASFATHSADPVGLTVCLETPHLDRRRCSVIQSLLRLQDNPARHSYQITFTDRDDNTAIPCTGISRLWRLFPRLTLKTGAGVGRCRSEPQKPAVTPGSGFGMIATPEMTQHVDERQVECQGRLLRDNNN